MSKNNDKVTIKVADLNIKRISTTELEENKRSKNQKIAYVRYATDKGTDSKLLFQTTLLTLDTYGIPRKPKDDEDEDKAFDRTFIKVPMNTEDKEGKVMYDKLTELDTHIDTNLKTQLFKTQQEANGYEYQPIVRVPDQEETIENGEQKYRPPYCKAKLDIDFDSGDILTKVYLKNSGPGAKRTLLTDVKTIDDLTKYVRYMSKVRLILMPNKVWAAKNKLGNAKKKSYGMSLKVMQIEVEPPVSNSVKDMLKDDAFIDDEDETTTSNTNNVDQTNEDDQVVNDENTEENADDNNEQEQEAKPEPPKPVVAPAPVAPRGRGKKTASKLDS